MNAICLNHFNISFTPLLNRVDLVVKTKHQGTRRLKSDFQQPRTSIIGGENLRQLFLELFANFFSKIIFTNLLTHQF